MDGIFTDFRQAQEQGSGNLLSTTLLPIAPPSDPARLRSFYRSTDKLNVEHDIRSQILYHHYPGYRLSKGEGNAWVDVYVAYWKFVGEYLVAEDALARGQSKEAELGRVYTAYKDVANALIRGYSSGQFQAWTIPCLYVVGKYLRLFAIKADEQAGTKEEDYDSGFQDDLVDDSGENEKLKDAARVINRVFTLCISDRQVT